MKADKRVQRSRDLLQRALVDLCVERGYAALSVQDILDRAVVGRATFYAHFKDKEDLLKSTIENLKHGMKRLWEEDLAAEGVPKGNLGFALPILKHIGASSDIYRAMLWGETVGPIVDRQFRRMVADLARTDLQHRPGLAARDLECAVQFIVGGLMGLISWWKDFEIDMSANQVNAIFLALALPGLDRLDDGKPESEYRGQSERGGRT